MSNILFKNKESDSNNQNELSGDDSLKLLVGEGKKYATVEDLAKGMVHGQNHITTLETEATSFKEAQAKQTSIDDILTAIKANATTEQQTPGDNQLPADQQKGDPKDTVDIAQQIKTAMAEQAQTSSAATNTELVSSTLSKSLGARANEVYTAVGKDLGVDLDELSKTSPEAVIKLCTGQQIALNPQTGITPANQHRQELPQANPNLQAGQMTYEMIQVHAAETKMPREERFKLEMAQALELGDHFYDKK